MSIDLSTSVIDACVAGPAGQTRSKATVQPLPSDVSSYPLLKAMTERRSRRFAKGMTMPGGPLAYQSLEPCPPLTLAEEATLAFAACGITGPALAELPYDSG